MRAPDRPGSSRGPPWNLLPSTPLRWQASLAAFGESRTLPAEAYASADVFRWEQEHFLEGAWFCAGRAAALAESGAQLAVRVGSESVLLVRDQASQLRGFFNVCRHRGHELLGVGEERRHTVIRCPYHAWVYDLDGRVRGAAGFPETPAETLSPVAVAEWRGWVFVNPSWTAPAFAEYVSRLDALLAPCEPERLVVAAREEYESRQTGRSSARTTTSATTARAFTLSSAG
jgi:Rieske 2Fe-2S family protein